MPFTDLYIYARHCRQVTQIFAYVFRRDSRDRLKPVNRAIKHCDRFKSLFLCFINDGRLYSFSISAE